METRRDETRGALLCSSALLLWLLLLSNRTGVQRRERRPGGALGPKTNEASAAAGLVSCPVERCAAPRASARARQSRVPVPVPVPEVASTESSATVPVVASSRLVASLRFGQPTSEVK